jgi:hypothetical protein
MPRLRLQPKTLAIIHFPGTGALNGCHCQSHTRGTRANFDSPDLGKGHTLDRHPYPLSYLMNWGEHNEPHAAHSAVQADIHTATQPPCGLANAGSGDLPLIETRLVRDRPRHRQGNWWEVTAPFSASATVKRGPRRPPFAAAADQQSLTNRPPAFAQGSMGTWPGSPSRWYRMG